MSTPKPNKRDRVAFTVPLDHDRRGGARVEGIVDTRHRDGTIEVLEMTGMQVRKADPAGGSLRGFDIEETRWTVPPSIQVEILNKHRSFKSIQRQVAREKKRSRVG